jgi:hypothetical protein
MRFFEVFSSLLPLTSRAAISERARSPYNEIDPERKVPDEYRILFHQDYTLEEHFEHIGQNLSETAEHFHAFANINGYRARLPYDVLHDRIRLDPGVEIVEHNTYQAHDISAPQAPDSVRVIEEDEQDDGSHRLVKRSWSETAGIRPWFLLMTNAGKKLALSPGVDVPDV